MFYLFLFFLPVFAIGQIHINECMPYPLSGSPEWIELYNSDSLLVFSTHEIWIEDATHKVKLEHITIFPHQYVVITKDTLSLKKMGFSSDCQYIQAQLPTLNNAKDNIKIRSVDGVLFDSISYTFKKEYRGKSLERIYDTVNNSMLSITLHPLGNTCGYLNSNMPLNHDLQLYSIQIREDSLRICFLNFGNVIIDDIEITIMLNTRSSVYNLENIMGKQIECLKIPLSELDIVRGMNIISIFSEHSKKDPRDYNNNDLITYYHSYPRRSIRINEINVTDHIYPEFLELKKNDNTIQYQDGYACIIDADTIPLTINDTSEYILITKTHHKQLSTSSCIYHQGFRLSDQGNTITIIDPNGTIMDSIDTHQLIEPYAAYIRSHSLEYIDSSQTRPWFISLHQNGATPGMPNTSIKQPIANEFRINLSNCEDVYLNCHDITIQHPYSIGVYSCDVFTLDGYFLQSIIMDKIITSDHTFPFDGVPSLNSSIYILRHRVRDYYGFDSFIAITPFIKRN